MEETAGIDWIWLTNGAIEAFKSWRVETGATVASAASYATGARAYVRFCRAAGVEPNDGVRSFRRHLAARDELSPRTQSDYRSHALSFVQFLQRSRRSRLGAGRHVNPPETGAPASSESTGSLCQDQPNLDPATDEPANAAIAPWPDSLQEASTTELLAGYARTLGILRSRGVLRTANAPLGDYAEWLVWQAFGGTLEPNSTKSHDVTDASGRRLQVKARLVSPNPKPGQLQTSVFRSWAFDAAVLIQLTEADYSVVRASMLPAALFDEGRSNAKWSKHVKGWAVFMTPELMSHSEAVDVTARLRAVT